MSRRRSFRPPVRPDRGGVHMRVRGLDVRRGPRAVLSGVDVDIRAGELLALVGPNGAGKSTLLGAICGDLPVSAGTIEFDGVPLSGWAPIDLARRRAMLPQRSTLSFPFTVAEVVAMGRAPWTGTPYGAQDDEAIAEAMRLTGVESFPGRVFSALSGGEQARVALARVLAQRTPMLLLDEPTAALDLHHQELVLTLARDRARSGDTVVVVLHDLGLAAAYADRIALLAGGRLVADGPPAEVLVPESLSTVYRHEIEVLPHPRTGTPLVLPKRPAAER
ncbi:heme ABC transporter ATP-binding protein [Micromonospora echinospora]|uniref:Iron complex transport system ATP-binding protein n=1 Tax=Micromonospora echinospora TaxID=1877 RepID=A0A1C4V3S4_MICEC|nr:heme ABC transporter ATP-binding protein [Micromonospora echinospora]OZV83064.1 heme ABC transporter ATP-binding protein [Micromonospora echinospora]SCE78622.1 iron complex transport system ATP-binding protein [Micromonospora echinospora]